MKIAIFFEGVDANPYITLLIRGLRQAGYDAVTVSSCSPRWLWQNRKTFRVLHFQWVQYFYSSGDAPSSTLWAIFFLAKLFIARSLGYKIIWTVHNLMPHESTPGYGDDIAHRGIAFLAHAIVVHSDKAVSLVQRAFRRRRRVHAIPHGHYIGWYPEAPTRNKARRYFGIPDSDYVYLHFGAIRPYKGVEALIGAFRKTRAARLIIAGKPLDEKIERAIREQSAHDSRISLHLAFIPDQLVPSFFACADAMVLPFSEVLTSGSAILALSFGLPVVAPGLGCLPELITASRGILFNPDDPGGLDQAMAGIRNRRFDREAIRHVMARLYDWSDIARRYATVYQSKDKDSL